jgi:hypothetical protein
MVARSEHDADPGHLGHEPLRSSSQSLHESEGRLDDLEFDQVIINDGTQADLLLKICNALIDGERSCR